MAMILDAFVRRFISKLSEFIEDEMSMMLGVKDELKKLGRKMETINGFLETAELKKHVDQNIHIWVKNLKDAMYDSDDIMDLCTIESKKLLEIHPSKSMVCHPLSLFSCFSCINFRHEIGSKIRELNKRLKEIVEDQSVLPKLEYINQDVHESRVDLRQTSSLENKSDIILTPISMDTQHLVDSLIKEDNKRCQVFGIVGMGGIGKTTFARHIYNDERIEKNFPIRVWACVSQNFSEIELLKQLIRSAGGNYGKANTKAELHLCLSSTLAQNFFIVLDDVWRTDVWEHLLECPLKNATASGRIVITTRHINVARSMSADVHHVKKMDIDSGWTMLRMKVFTDDEEEISSLREIGVKIVEKCDGLPLAIKTIAGVLKLKKKSSLEWSKVLKSDAWSMSQLQAELPGALFLSYKDLPSNLKQCFLYCSLYPTAHRNLYHSASIHRESLIHLWVTEGLIKETQEDKLMEDAAEDYYTELVSRNLLHEEEDGWCTMHDLLRSLALFLRGDESAILHDAQSLNISPLTKIRYLSMINMVGRLPDVIKQQQCLRTLRILGSPQTNMVVNDIVEKDIVDKLRHLRILIINWTRLESLPDSLGNLLLLKHLDLHGTKIKELPKSIGCLVNLEKLSLQGCYSLCTLPKAITKLCNLRCLFLRGTRLTHVPKGIGKLKHLNHLEGFVVGHDDTRAQDEEGCDLEELYSLSKLRFLEIDRLERAQAGGALVLANSHFMRTLILRGKEDYQEAAIHGIEKTYGVLSPPSTLQTLKIINFFGAGFPKWIMTPSASLPNLTSIELERCRSCSLLPPLGMLPQLKSLLISEAHAITAIGPEFLGSHASSAKVAFPKLEMLSFLLMLNWEEWSFGMMEGVEEERRGAPKLLPRLRKLILDVCPKLRALPEGLRHATKLQELRLSDTCSLIEVNNLPSLTESLSIFLAPMFERVSNLPSLKHLQISYCLRLQHVENLNKLQHLSLDLDPCWMEGPSETSTTNDDEQIQRLPEWLLGLLGQHQHVSAALQNLRKFDLKCSTPLLKTFLKDGPNWPIIQWIPEVTVFGDCDLSYIRYTKAPPTFETRIVEPMMSIIWSDSMDLPSPLLW